MTPQQLQSEIDGLFAESKRLMSDGERRAASYLLGVMRRFQGYLPQKPVEPPEDAPAPELEPEPAEDAPAPTRRQRRPRGL